MDLGLKDRVYVITGATRGLGFATAEALVADGAKVVVSGRTDEAATEAAAQLGAGSAVGIGADNADPETAGRLIEMAKTRFGRFDGVLISVGGPPAGVPADSLSDEQWRSAFETVFLGAVRLARTAAGELGEGGITGRGGLVDGHSSCWITSNDHSSLAVPTGPPVLCPLWPCWNAGLLTQAWKASSERQRVYTR